jgi:hypothetical protein
LTESPARSSSETISSANLPHRFIKGETQFGLVNERAVSIHHDAMHAPFLPTAFIFGECRNVMVNRMFHNGESTSCAGSSRELCVKTHSLEREGIMVGGVKNGCSAQALSHRRNRV